MACPDVSRCEHGGGSGARGPMSLGRTLAMLRDARILAGKKPLGAWLQWETRCQED